MARVIIRPEDQIRRINELRNEVERFRSMDRARLIHRRDEQSWSLLEIIEHMSISHQLYVEKIDGALRRLPDARTPVDAVRTRMIPSFLIKRFPPKDGKIRFKMKTMKVFEPVLDHDKLGEQDIREVFDRFFASLEHLKKSIESYRMKEVKRVRFSSAIGPIVKFNVAEACEFILCHNERHLWQMKQKLDS